MEFASDHSDKTNNINEGWYNRFRLVIGKHHLDLYSALAEFQKEQADTEIAIVEVGLGRKIKAEPKKKWIDFTNRIRTVILDYNTFKDERKLDFLYTMLIS